MTIVTSSANAMAVRAAAHRSGRLGLDAVRPRPEPAAFVADRNLARVIDPTLVPPDGEASLDADYGRDRARAALATLP